MTAFDLVLRLTKHKVALVFLLPLNNGIVHDEVL